MLDILLFILVNLLGAMSPGPDFAIVTRYGLTGSRQAALMASLGVAVALIIHVTYCVSGVALILSSSPRLYMTVRLIGALYLGYLGIKILLESRKAPTPQTPSTTRSAFLAGFLTNLLNPKATVFLLSLFTQFAPAMATLGMKFAFALSVPLSAFLWFASLSYMMTHPYFLPFILKHRVKFLIAMGTVLCLLALWGTSSLI